MFKFFLVSTMLFSIPTLACFDPEAKALPMSSVLSLASNNGSLTRCLQKLTRAGVNLEQASALRKERPAGKDIDPLYRLSIQGQNRNNEPRKLIIDAYLIGHKFVCGEVSNRITRGCM